ncbi:1,4-alpha-glucan branching protein GlgB [[Clostridium] innocuum]|uniref:1,4-alpha-glucan branching protein GlgB n=1 Tax=Clostridium innocuum TaxID=1522 RepID=UPI0022DEE24E|nr:1,4-alpha-glucan branching protein GlgB [[Clostridium] innocuum]
MKNKIMDRYYKGCALDAYKLFGAHLCEERGKKGVRFTVYAPHAQGIQVIGSFDDWSCKGHQMRRKDDKGIWSLFVAEAKEGDMYKYRVTQATGRIVDKMDPYAFYSELRPNTASIVTNLDYKKWSDEKWLAQRTKNFDKPVNIYEMHLGSWKKDEDQEWVNYKDIAKELIAYVKENNFTHIELMPLNEYPFDGSWGYQCSGYFSATSRYGSAQELMYLINACHRANIGIIMDFVPVHFVRDDFSLSYFDGTPLYEYEKACDADSQWGTANFNLWREEVRSFLMSAAAFWIDKYHVDGLRMDAISNIIHWHGNKDLGENEGALHFIKRMNYHLSEAYKGVMLIAEDSSDFANVTKATQDGGLGFDYKWDLGWMNDTLKYLEKDPIYRKWHHNNITFSMAYFYSERFIMEFSHDEVVHGKKTIVDKIWGSYEEKFAQLRTLYLYMFTHPGKKLNFMGNELAHFREWDEEKQCDWDLLKYPMHDAFHRYFAKLGELYSKTPALYETEYDWTSFQWIDADNADENVFSYLRKNENSYYIVILNFSPNAYKKHAFGVPEKGVYHELLNTEQDIWGGEITELGKMKAVEKECNKLPYTIEVDVPAFGGVLLELKKRKKPVKKAVK